MTKGELANYCDSGLARLDSIADNIFSVATTGKTEFTAIELAAMSAFIHYLYAVVEDVIKEILKFDGISEPTEENVHQKLLKTAGELGIIPPDLFQPLSDLLSFRNAFVLTQTESAGWEALSPLVAELEGFRKHFRQEVLEYLAVVESE